MNKDCDEFDMWCKNRLTKNDIYSAIFEGMTNGEVIKTVFNTKMIDDRYLWESLKVIICGEDDSWWNSPYNPQEREDGDTE